MGKIIELNQLVANQIAAGEVIERPASVIKELVENALDAGARTIEVRIKDGGFDHMVVEDDGAGMDEEDLKLAIKRYATSKLATVSDLYHLLTFGFRGEALPSIASISHMSIMSRTKMQDLGTKAVIEAGVIRDIYSAPASLGTRIEVRNLFFNVPARLKFARSKRTESAEIDRLLKSLAYVHPEIDWKFFVDNKLVFALNKSSNAVDLARGVLLLGQDTEGFLYPFSSKSDLMSVFGVIASPMVIRRDMRGIFFFVNQRLIADKKLMMAVKTAFRSLLEVGRSPVCALNIVIAPDLVDVNVHPRKAEVRFFDERRVIPHFFGMLNDFLAKTPWLSNKNPSLKDTVGSWSSGAVSKREESREFDSLSSERKILNEKPLGMIIAKGAERTKQDLFFSQQKPMLHAERFSDLKIIGQARLTYLITEGEYGLVLIDQHAAHERIIYEKIREKENLKTSSHPLLIPLSLNLSPQEMAMLEEHLSDLFNLGIEAELFSKDMVVIRSLPGILLQIDVKSLIKSVLNDFSEFGSPNTADELFSRIYATVACHSAIRAGDRLSKEQISALLADLDSTSFHAHCPHGRPIVKSFLDQEMKRWFDRT